MKSYISEGVNALQYAVALVQSNEVLQTIELALSVAVSIVLIAFRVYKWYKLAKSDGKITKEEIDEIVDNVEEELNDIKDDIDEHKKGK